MFHFVQDNLNVYCLACCDVECCQFCLSGQRHDMLDSMHDVEDGSIIGQDVSVVGEKEVAACLAFYLGLVEGAGVAVDREGHVAH